MNQLLKVTVILCTLLLHTTPSRAQEDDMPALSEERIREIKAQKTAYLTTKLGLTPEEAQRFWPIYNEYDKVRDEHRRELRELVRAGRKNDQDLTETQAQEVLNKGLIVRQKELDLERTYKDRFVMSIGAVKTVELHKAERDFQREVLRRYRERSGGPEGRPGPPPDRR
jgi:hypothetical protein